jgi:selenocysteine lyase/cysteine desulfurase
MSEMKPPIEATSSTDLAAYIGNTQIFPVLNNWDFFNHAGVAPIPSLAADALRRYASQAETAAYLNAGWHVDAEALRQSAAKLLNCHRDEIAFIKNTSEGISIVASGLDWQWGDVIVTTGVEYPANVYPWMDVARTRGAKLVMVPEEDGPDGCRLVPTDKILQAASDPRTKLVSLSHVEFASGQRHDLQQIGQFCAERKIRFCVDAIQSLGILPVDVQAMHIDYLSADGHKWLLGPEGAGIFFCRRALIEYTQPLMVGWMNVVDAQNFGHYDFSLRPDAGRFECGSYNIPGLLALKASLELLLNLGTQQVADRIRDLTTLLIGGLQAKGYQIVSPRADSQWSGIVSFTSSKHNHERLCMELRKDNRTELAVRENRLRCSPHFYNTEEQIQRLLSRLPNH